MCGRLRAVGGRRSVGEVRSFFFRNRVILQRRVILMRNVGGIVLGRGFRKQPRHGIEAGVTTVLRVRHEVMAVKRDCQQRYYPNCSQCPRQPAGDVSEACTHPRRRATPSRLCKLPGRSNRHASGTWLPTGWLQLQSGNAVRILYVSNQSVALNSARDPDRSKRRFSASWRVQVGTARREKPSCVVGRLVRENQSAWNR